MFEFEFELEFGKKAMSLLPLGSASFFQQVSVLLEYAAFDTKTSCWNIICIIRYTLYLITAAFQDA